MLFYSLRLWPSYPSPIRCYILLVCVGRLIVDSVSPKPNSLVTLYAQLIYVSIVGINGNPRDRRSTPGKAYNTPL